MITETTPPNTFINLCAIQGARYCASTLLISHPRREAMLEYLKSICCDSQERKEWQCAACGGWHHLCCPIEASGTSSGSHSIRSDAWKNRVNA